MSKLRSRVCGSGTEKSEKSHKAPSNSHFDKEVCPSHIFFQDISSQSSLRLNSTSCLSPPLIVSAFLQAKKTTKMMKKTIRTRKILIISQRLDETDWKYLRISVWAPSTFSWVSSTLASILFGSGRKKENKWCAKLANSVHMQPQGHITENPQCLTHAYSVQLNVSLTES